MITVSACLIVKNESKVLARCLEGVKKIADEIIVVDTGSTDDTKAIAADYTDKIYDFAWTDDFAEARNFSFSKASMEYIYTADADEILDEENIAKFLQLKQVLLPEIEIVQMYYTNQLEYNTTYNFDEEYRPKLYKRLRTFEWVDPIHESVRLTPIIYDSEIRIIHKPMNSHAGRDFYGFQKALMKNGTLSDKLIGMYARELMIAGEEKDFKAAYPYFLTLVDSADLEETRFKQCQCIVARASRLIEDENVFMQTCLKNVALEEPSSEVCYELGQYYIGKANAKEASIWFYNAAYEAAPELNQHYSGDLALLGLKQCYEMLGEKEQSEEYARLAQDWIENHRGGQSG